MFSFASFAVQDWVVINNMRDIDDAVVLNLLPTWEPDVAVRKKILVDNPARLFGS